MYRVFALGVAALTLAVATGAARAAQPALAQVMVLGDSVATGMSWHEDAIAVMQRNLDVDWQVAVCRRLTGVSCTLASLLNKSPAKLASVAGPASA